MVLIDLTRCYYQSNLYLVFVCEKGREKYQCNGKEMALVNVDGAIFNSGGLNGV